MFISWWAIILIAIIIAGIASSGKTALRGRITELEEKVEELEKELEEKSDMGGSFDYTD